MAGGDRNLRTAPSHHIAGNRRTRQVRSAAGAEMRVTRERIRQICNVACHRMRQFAQRHPEGELAHATRATAQLAETAGLKQVYQYRRPSQNAKDHLAEQMLRLGAITPPQAPALPTACALVSKPAGKRSNLRGVERELARVVNQHPEGIEPREAVQLLERWSSRLKQWPQLDATLFAKAWLGSSFGCDGDGEDGRIHPARARNAPDTSLTRHYVALVLHDAGKCLKVEQIAEWASQLAAPQKIKPFRKERCRAILVADPRFRWVGNSTYGLADWNVGHSDPSYKQGPPAAGRRRNHILPGAAQQPHGACRRHETHQQPFYSHPRSRHGRHQGQPNTATATRLRHTAERRRRPRRQPSSSLQALITADYEAHRLPDFRNTRTQR